MKESRRHRELAIETWSGGTRYNDVHCGSDYVATGDNRGLDPIIQRIARAIAEAECRGIEIDKL